YYCSIEYELGDDDEEESSSESDDSSDEDDDDDEYTLVTRFYEKLSKSWYCQCPTGERSCESPIELLKGINEQHEEIQIEFLRWFSVMTSTQAGRLSLIGVEDDLVSTFTDYILNETYSKSVKYEIIVLLYNLLYIDSNTRVRIFTRYLQRCLALTNLSFP
ncbi:unnamed protein product, partial [Didymodactylos carnosus]